MYQEVTKRSMRQDGTAPVMCDVRNFTYKTTTHRKVHLAADELIMAVDDDDDRKKEVDTFDGRNRFLPVVPEILGSFYKGCLRRNAGGTE